jgi:hypothetical protein
MAGPASLDEIAARVGPDLLRQAQQYFPGHTAAVGVLMIEGEGPKFLKSGENGGPWGGTHRGGIPRLPGFAFTQGGASQGNIATHVEGHAAAIMWQRDLKKALLLVDREMCSICGRFLYTTLPPGSMMTVWSADEGVTIVRASHG